MNIPTLLESLHNGSSVLGTLIVSPSPRWLQSVRGCGLDFVFIDTEHVAMDRHQLSWMCQAYQAIGLPPIVRIPSPDPFAATMALDGGAAGIIAPYIESAAQVRALRGAVKLRPLKGKKLEAVLAGGEMEPELAAYLDRPEHRRALIVNIESVPAIAALDEILAEPGLDAVLIGPHDLSCSLGVPEQYTHPKFREAARTIFTKARQAGIGAGIHFWDNLDLAREFIAEGANLFIHSSDVRLFTANLHADLQRLRPERFATPDSQEPI